MYRVNFTASSAISILLLLVLQVAIITATHDKQRPWLGRVDSLDVENLSNATTTAAKNSKEINNDAVASSHNNISLSNFFKRKNFYNKKNQQNKYLKILAQQAVGAAQVKERQRKSALLSNDDHHQNRRKRSPGESMCVSLCKCRNDTFLTVVCELDNNDYIIGPHHYQIPPNAISVHIKLSLSLTIMSRSFSDMSVNNLVIEGRGGGTKQIEISEYAFDENRAKLPKINITNCNNVILREHAMSPKSIDAAKPFEFMLYIDDAVHVTIFMNAFINTRFHGYFSKIQDLDIQENGFFDSPESVIIISNAVIVSLRKLANALKGFEVMDSIIKTIESGAFDAIQMPSIVFRNCAIEVIKSKMITNRLLSNYSEFSGCKIGTIESKAIYECGITNLVIENNEIHDIKDNAISTTTINLSFSKNSVKHTGINWLNIKDWDNITIFNNTFGKYNRIEIAQIKSNPRSCTFHKNSFTFPEPRSLDMSHKMCDIGESYFFHECSCKFDWIHRLSSKDLKKTSYCRIENILERCFNASVFNVHQYEVETCGSSNKNIICMEVQKKKKPTEERYLNPNTLNQDTKSDIFLYIYIGCGVIVLAVLICCLFLIVRRYWKTRHPVTIPMSVMPNSNQNTILQMKGSKSFSNDDRRIINQTLETMRNKQPREKYDQVYNNTKKLLEGNLTESEKVATIGEIVGTIDEFENAGEDFVAFTGILFNHLAPRDNNQNDPVYAEPMLMRDPLPPPPLYDEGQTILEDHIYAEPNSVQQPLLTNEYATPLDRRNESCGPVYSEPVVNERERTVITPYAIGNQRNQLPSVPPTDNSHQPSTSHNLPDVLSTKSTATATNTPSTLTKPQTNVQKLAQNFANNPNFHITRSPTTNRKIPQYTIPSKLSAAPTTSKSSEPSSSAAAMASGGGGGTDSDSSNSHSDHSGGSDVTFKLDEIEYVDA